MKQRGFSFMHDPSTLGRDPAFERLDWIDRIISKIGYPKSATRIPTSAHWQKAEDELSLKFAPSHKRLIDLFGSGVWAGFIEVFSPHPEHRWRYEHDEVIRAVQGYPEGDYTLPYSIYPEKNGLIPFANTGTRTDIALHPKSTDPELWDIVLIDCDYPCEVYSWTAPEFIYRILTGNVPGKLLSGPPCVKYRCGAWGEHFDPCTD